MRTRSTTRQLSAQSLRGPRGRRPGHQFVPLVVGQCFDIDISPDDSGWLIRIPEIGASTRASRRAAVGPAARECIAARTGIPIGYVAVRVRD